MAEYIRSGADRRNKNIPVEDERRNGEDRRAAHRDANAIIECMRKIPIFGGLTSGQYEKILNICSKKLIPGDQYLIKAGDESNELFVLMKGQLEVVTKSGALIAYISTLGLVGEMGVFTGTPRSASVVASEDCVVFRISRVELFELFETDCQLGNRILLNVISDLTGKLNEDNTVIEELRKRRSRIL